MNGSYGKYLDVDLTHESIREYPIPEDWSRRFIGGKGLAARLLLEELPDRVDPFGAENSLVFATGPFQGTSLAGAGRHVVLAVSPKTGSVADSYVGGYFGHELGRSGYDGILIRGMARAPVYLALIEGRAELLAASDLWGRGTGETEQLLQARHPRSRVASIGPAGEGLVFQACIISDRSRSAGRPGLGAVMGSKRLKAVVVVGHAAKTLHDPERFAAERADYAKTFLDEGSQSFGEYGTGRGATWLSEQGLLPTKNFQESTFPAAERIGGERMHDTILVGRETCAGCPIRCKRLVQTSFAGTDVEPAFGGPEYETIAALGSLCLNENLDAIALGNQLCNDYGLDTISTGVAIAFLMEASERRLIGEELRWGDPHAVISMIHSLARREGLGDRLADGLRPFAQSIGAPFAMEIKGVELPMHEPRGKQGMGLTYATSPRGASHMEGFHDTAFVGDAPCPELGIDHGYDRFSLADKPHPVVTFENLQSFSNCLVLCTFTTRDTGRGYSYPRIRSLLEAATGLILTPQEMLDVGARAYGLLRLLSARSGHTIEDDRLPDRFQSPLLGGASAGHPVAPAEMTAAIKAYYDERGYDPYGPTDATLSRLNMADCVGKMPR
jgi:aldehyde:ferredoxin oxidoreductase